MPHKLCAVLPKKQREKMDMDKTFIKNIMARFRDLQYGTWSLDERLSSAKAEITNLQASILGARDEKSVSDYARRLKSAEEEYRRLLKLARKNVS